jgi:uncharacterized damage-inducible protein DinB
MNEIIGALFRYNTWAMDQFFLVLHQLTVPEYSDTEASGNGSIRDTLVHMMSVQWGYTSWFDRSAEAPLALARVRELKGPMFDTSDKAEARWRDIDRQTRAFADRVTDEQLREIWQWNLPDGRSLALPLWQLTTHVANHQTHTRAQIVAAMRRIGKEPKVSEFLLFAIRGATSQPGRPAPD